MKLSLFPSDAQERRKEEKQRRKAEKARANNTGGPRSLTSMCRSHAVQCHEGLIKAKPFDAVAFLTGPESPPDSQSEASDDGAAEAPERQQDTAAARKPSVEREDWMTKAMPKANPGEPQESTGQPKDEPAKKVTLPAFTQPASWVHHIVCAVPGWPLLACLCPHASSTMGRSQVEAACSASILAHLV